MAKKKIIDGYVNAVKLYAKTHKVEKRKGTKPDLCKLKENQAVCYGDGKTYYVLLTKNAPKKKIFSWSDESSSTKIGTAWTEEPNRLNETYHGTEWKQ